MAQQVKNAPVMRETGDLGSIPGSGRSPGEGNDNPLLYSCQYSLNNTAFSSILGLPWWAQTVKNLSANAGDPGLIPGLGRCPGEGNGYPLQYSCLENPMDRGA